MKTNIAIVTTCILLCAGLSGHAQTAASTPATASGITITMKDGKTTVASKLRRVEGNVMATVQIGTGVGDIGYPVGTIAKIDFPEPAQIKASTDLLAQGKATAALTQIDPIVSYHAPFKDVPGNWWSQSVRLKLNALVALKRDTEATALVDEILKNSTDPEAARSAQVLMAASLVRKGELDKAATICDDVIKASNDPDTLSLAWVTKGRSRLASKNWDSALLAYLNVPVFYPDQTALMPQVLLGSGRAYAGIEDKAEAQKNFDELISKYPDSSEAAEAKTDLKKLKNKP